MNGYRAFPYLRFPLSIGHTLYLVVHAKRPDHLSYVVFAGNEASAVGQDNTVERRNSEKPEKK